MHLLSVEGVTGKEKEIAEAVSDELAEGRRAGLGDPLRRRPQAHPVADRDRQSDRRPARHAPRTAPPLLDAISTPCRSAPARSRGARATASSPTARRRSAATTAPAARCSSLVETLLKHKLPHPPITLLFTVREESGLHGARELDPKDLGGATMCFNVDGQPASELIIGAVGQENWEVGDQGQGVARRRRAGEGHLGHAGRRARPRRGAARRLVRQGR